MASETVDNLLSRRIDAAREACHSSIAFDAARSGNGLTDRAWLAQSVLNILAGVIDDQLKPAAQCDSVNGYNDRCVLALGHIASHAAVNAAGAVCVEWSRRPSSFGPGRYEGP